MNPFVHLRTTALIVGLLSATLGQAQSLIDDYNSAQKVDATYAAALSEFESASLQARIAGSAYYPEARFSRTQLPGENKDRQTLSLTQPLISLDRWLSLKEEAPRIALAENTLQKSQYDLASKLYKAIAALADAREKQAINHASVQALTAQTEMARKAFELGQGTITDVYDTQVRLSQAQAQTYSLRANLQTAQRLFETTVGKPANPAHYTLSTAPVQVQLPPLDQLLTQAVQQSPVLRASDVAITLANIGRQRARASYLPTLVASAQRSDYNGVTGSSSGVALRMDIPLDAGNAYRAQSADLAMQKAQSQERITRQQVELDVQRLYSDVEAAIAEVGVRKEGMRVAEQSLQATEQSFAGGVRTKIDVLNALQTVHQSKSEHLTALLNLGDKLLNLNLTSGQDIEPTLRLINQHIFQP